MRRAKQFSSATEFVEALCQALTPAVPKAAGQGRDGLRSLVSLVTGDFLERHLRPQGIAYRLVAEDAEGGAGKEPVALLGVDFCPDLVIEVGEVPTVAIRSYLVEPQDDAPAIMGAAIGEAIAYAWQYPRAIAVVLDRGEGRLLRHWWDREFLAELWDKHGVKLLVIPG